MAAIANLFLSIGFWLFVVLVTIWAASEIISYAMVDDPPI
jgi:hypothetical protein